MVNEAANHNDPRVHALSDSKCHKPVTQDSLLTSNDALREVGPNAVELQRLASSRHVEHPSLDQARRKKRRAWKQERKRSQLRRREEMKFSHSIQFNAVPDWSSHYISYSNLKKLYDFRGILGGVFVEVNPSKLSTS